MNSCYKRKSIHRLNRWFFGLHNLCSLFLLQKTMTKNVIVKFYFNAVTKDMCHKNLPNTSVKKRVFTFT